MPTENEKQNGSCIDVIPKSSGKDYPSSNMNADIDVDATLDQGKGEQLINDLIDNNIIDLCNDNPASNTPAKKLNIASSSRNHDNENGVNVARLPTGETHHGVPKPGVEHTMQPRDEAWHRRVNNDGGDQRVLVPCR